MSFGENLKRLRTSAGFTQSEFAKRLDITQSMLCQLERGTKSISLALARDAAEVLNCGINDIIEEGA